MKKRFLALAIAFFGVFTLSSSFTPASGQLPGTVTVQEGDCIATLNFIITNIEVNDGVVTGDLTDAATGADLGDVTLTGASCTSLTFDLDGTLTLTGWNNVLMESCTVTLDEEALVFNSGIMTRKGGGQSNLIYNSLCSIAHLLGTNASDRAIIAHFDNLFRRMAQLAL